MDYLKLVIALDDRYQESFIAEMADLEFDAFEQREGRLITYVPKERFAEEDRERIERLLAACPGEGRIQSEEVVADRNWNEQWEKTIRAQQIGRFLVRPTWSSEEPPEGMIPLVIDPKMAFGTGYHETTRLMLKLLPGAVGKGDRVLDAGTGSGILAIAAAKLGAGRVLAFDIDEWSIENTRENIHRNDVSGVVEVRKGSVEVAGGEETFDLVAANIQRNTILEMLPAFRAQMVPGGILLLSGLLKSDRREVADALEGDFSGEEIAIENEWIAIRARRTA